jgi:hypothetical protein
MPHWTEVQFIFLYVYIILCICMYTHTHTLCMREWMGGCEWVGGCVLYDVICDMCACVCVRESLTEMLPFPPATCKD